MDEIKNAIKDRRVKDIQIEPVHKDGNGPWAFVLLFDDSTVLHFFVDDFTINFANGDISRFLSAEAFATVRQVMADGI